ncbi:xanthine dehydrogenase family protein molybdopterin-binding subunit [Galbibacter sp. BG1]|uniref:xanthine dehydrogenase family protein molybdopterin-binding subunit n=1 Tax=Galbibacter sp. BG1 TaxID=1170699 RepID=UPI0015BB60AC|nr:molybdopterin cofactor-binding domain-containing protein [Galbibacter sp. BG1]QLE00186.1 xanthine dehydrogenase family protein molybdopterin-binding subunit [Galbibacter sp. BG1]
MKKIQTGIGRRSFIKSVSMAGGGLVIGFNWLACKKAVEAENKEVALEMPDEWFELNGYLKVGDNGVVTIYSPNPEIGQNVKTSMPMIVAEELDVDWKNVVVEQAPLNTDVFKRQIAGGSQSIRQSWETLRMAGATAREMLLMAAAEKLEVPLEELSVNKGIISHKNSDKSISYGDVAATASKLEVPKEVALKEKKDFSIIGTSRKNVDGKKIVTGQPLFGLDTYQDDMLIAMIVHPPAFGKRLNSFDPDSIKDMPGIVDVVELETFKDDYKRSAFDTDAFDKLVVVVGKSTWEVMNAKKALKVDWEESPEIVLNMDIFGRDTTVSHPKGLESTEDHVKMMDNMASKGAKIEVARKDGDTQKAFKTAARTIERSYYAPFLAHNCMEPMNFFADVTDDKATLIGPIQTPEFMENSVAERLGMPKENIEIQMTRMGGGFGRRLYGHFVTEAAALSQKLKSPVKLIYTREDDMTFGTYRPAYHAHYKAALDENNNLIGFHVRAGGIPESPLFSNRFPAGAVENYLAESWTIDSNITTGAFRAPRSNFIAGAEQAFLDEVAEEAGKDPIDFRLELLNKAKENPVGEKNDYDAERYIGVLNLVRKMSNWDTNASNSGRGVAAYYCHNSYVAHVLDLSMENSTPRVDNVYCALDCGIVVNPDAATNMAEGGTIDGIGSAMYGEISFKNGNPQQSNFDTYRLIRQKEAPKNIEVSFVKNDTDPTGLGEPPFPPVMGALANALYKATGKRFYKQPFIKELNEYNESKILKT